MDLIGARAHAVLTTRRRAEGLQSSPVLLSADESGVPLLTSSAATAKIRNLRRDPRATLCVLGDDFFGRWVTLHCLAEIEPLPGALDDLVAFYARRDGYRPGAHTDDELLTVWQAEERVLVRLPVERVSRPGRRPGPSRGPSSVPF